MSRSLTRDGSRAACTGSARVSATGPAGKSNTRVNSYNAGRSDGEGAPPTHVLILTVLDEVMGRSTRFLPSVALLSTKEHPQDVAKYPRRAQTPPLETPPSALDVSRLIKKNFTGTLVRLRQ